VNGEKVGGRKRDERPEQGAQREYRQVDLQDGDKIRVGKHRMQVQIEQPVAATVSEEGSSDEPDEVPDELEVLLTGANKIVVPSLVKIEQPLQEGLKQLEKPTFRSPAKEDEPPSIIKGEKEALSLKLEEIPAIASYRIKKKIGEGSFGLIYLVQHQQKRDYVALKVMKPEIAAQEEMRQRFLHEIAVAHKLRHPHIVRLIDYGSAGWTFYFTMDYCEAGSLWDLIKQRGGKLPLRHAVPIMRQVLQAMAYVHQKGYVHRDIKPANILLTCEMISCPTRRGQRWIDMLFLQHNDIHSYRYTQRR
jgi:hypothetical protein